MGRILASVTDKTGIEKFKRLTDEGWKMVSTGGTSKKLTEFNIPHELVEEVTEFPEMLDGRLKTLHPNIFGGILADRSKPTHLDQVKENGIELIDVVAVNLYDFKSKPGIEEIDIGGPSLLRAAAKNGASVAVLVDPEDYDHVINQLLTSGSVYETTREELALKVFEHTARYDAMIAEWMRNRYRRGINIFAQPVRSGH